MSRINFFSLALALSLASLAQADLSQDEGITQEPRELPNDPTSILDTLFGTVNLEEPLRPSEISELFRRLVEEHKAAIPADKLEQVEYLYSVSQADKSKCDYETFEKINKALVNYGQFRVYLKAFKDLLWEDVCRPALQNQVADIVGKYDKNDVQDLYLLTKIDLEDGDGLWAGFGENVATFILYKLDGKELDMKEFRNKEKFLKIYKEIIGGACERPMNDLAPMMRVYDLLFPEGSGEFGDKYAKQIADQLIRGVDDGLTMWWISTIRICRALVEDDLLLVSQNAQHILTAPQPIGRKIKNFFGGLFKPKN